MLSDVEKEVFKDLCESEDCDDIFKVIEKLQDETQTVESIAITNAAGHLMRKAIHNEIWRNKK